MKKPISATIDEKLIGWISKETERSNLYRNKSHLIEAALEQLKQKIEVDEEEINSLNTSGSKNIKTLQQSRKQKRSR